MNKIHYLCVMEVKENCQLSNILSVYKMQVMSIKPFIIFHGLLKNKQALKLI